MRIAKEITFADVLAGKPTMVFYGATTCWWTHDPKDLSCLPHHGVPCDPRGGVLFETNKPGKFLQDAAKNEKHYGKHGLRAFMLAHHGCVVTDRGAPTCFATWDEYSDLIDAHEGNAEEENSDVDENPH